ENSSVVLVPEISEGIALQIRSAERGLPITPVDETNISLAGHPRSFASSPAHLWAAARPSSPLQALAFPEFTSTARSMWPDATRFALETRTGAAGNELVVNTAAAFAGRSDSKRPRSNPLFLIPAAT